jgi:predicted acyltransferase
MTEKKRLLSLDLFRGATIAGMLLVNNPGTWSAVYAPLEHAQWNGCTPTDLIFPFFLFIVGVAIPFSFQNRMDSGQDRVKLHLQVLRRACILFLLGLFLNSLAIITGKLTLNPLVIWPELRIPGVLQRIAICYFFASLVVLNLGLRAQVAISLLLLFGYGMLMTAVPIPVDVNGVITWEAGVLEKGVNLSAMIDGVLLKGHVWKTTSPWDPEGVLSTLPAIATTLFGVFTGVWLRQSRTDREKLRGMIAMGTVGVAAGLLMNAWFPVNKNLWSSSYTVLTAGLALYSLALCYFLVDMKGYRKGIEPFIVYGSNAITVFVLSGVFARITDFIKFSQAGGTPVSLKVVIYQALFASWLPPKAASAAYALAFVLLWYGIMYIFYKRKIFIKI